MIDHVLADDAASLARALDLLHGLEVVGVDVERADWDRYFRAAALVQIGGQGRVALVDPMRLDDLQPVRELLASRVCVLHAMENDLGPLATLGIVPAQLEDTAVAASLLGLPTGLEALLAELLGVQLPGDKAAMQRADWEARPISERMLAYAAGDVADLPQLWAVLRDCLEQAGRLEWYRQEVEAVAAQPPVEQRRDWLRTKGAGRLDPAARARLRALWDAREKLARDTDTAPGRIANDKVLVDLAARPPAGTGELGRRGMRRQAVRAWGEALLEALAGAESRAHEPTRRERRGSTDVDRELVETLRCLRSVKAAELGIDPGILCPSRTLMRAVLADPATPGELVDALGLLPWQWDQLAEDFCAAMGLPAGQVETHTATPLTRETACPKERAMADLLNPDAVHASLDSLEGWQGTTSGISKTYRFDDAASAEAFLTRVSTLADGMNHHPEVTRTGDHVTFTLVTHSAGGVTQLDFDLAERIDAEV